MAAAQEPSRTAALAAGLEALLLPLVQRSDAALDEVQASQVSLGSAIDRLVAELEQLSASVPEGTAAAHAARLALLRRRVAAMSASLDGVQGRLNRLHAALARLPSTTLSELARQELHAPPPPRVEDLAARAGQLGAGPEALLAATAVVDGEAAAGAGRPFAPPPPQDTEE